MCSCEIFLARKWTLGFSERWCIYCSGLVSSINTDLSWKRWNNRCALGLMPETIRFCPAVDRERNGFVCHRFNGCRPRIQLHLRNGLSPAPSSSFITRRPGAHKPISGRRRHVLTAPYCLCIQCMCDNSIPQRHNFISFHEKRKVRWTRQTARKQFYFERVL